MSIVTTAQAHNV